MIYAVTEVWLQYSTTTTTHVQSSESGAIYFTPELGQIGSLNQL